MKTLNIEEFIYKLKNNKRFSNNLILDVSSKETLLIESICDMNLIKKSEKKFGRLYLTQ